MAWIQTPDRKTVFKLKCGCILNTRNAETKDKSKFIKVCHKHSMNKEGQRR